MIITKANQDQKVFFSYSLLMLSLAYTVLLILSNITSNKLTEFFGIVFDAGFLFFPLTYVLNDIITEVYGFKISRKVIWLGLSMNIISSVMLLIVIKMPNIDIRGEHFNEVFNSSYLIFIGSTLSYLVGEFINSYTMSKLKIVTKGAFYHTRSVSSTFIGVFFETILFFLIAFYNIVTIDILVQMIVTQVILKTIIAILCVHISYKLVKWLQKIDDVDILLGKNH